MSDSNVTSLYVIIAAISFGLPLVFSTGQYALALAVGGIWTLNVLLRLSK